MTEKPRNETALSIGLSPSGAMTPRTVEQALEMAKMIAKSGMVPKQYTGNPGAVLIAMQMGAELGLPPLASLQNIAVINGRPSIWGDAMLAIVTAHPLCEDVVEWMDGDTAHCKVKRRGRSVIERTFSMADAKTAGLAGKQGPWMQYPKRMLQMRARGFALRDAFPDLLRGIMPAEEARDIVNMTPAFAGEPQEGRFSAAARPADVGQSGQNMDISGQPEKSQPIPTDPAPVPTELPQLSDGAMEFLGMIDQAKTADDIKALINAAGVRKFTKADKTEIQRALRAKDGELTKDRGGQPQEGLGF